MTARVRFAGRPKTVGSRWAFWPSAPGNPPFALDFEAFRNVTPRIICHSYPREPRAITRIEALHDFGMAPAYHCLCKSSPSSLRSALPLVLPRAAAATSTLKTPANTPQTRQTRRPTPLKKRKTRRTSPPTRQTTLPTARARPKKRSERKSERVKAVARRGECLATAGSPNALSKAQRTQISGISAGY